MSSVDASFRYANAADAPHLHALIERAYRGPENAGGWNSESHLLQGPRSSIPEIEQLIGREDSRFVLAESCNSRLIGCALLQRVGSTACSADGSGRSGSYFGMFAVEPLLRSHGVGSLLLAECERRVVNLWNADAMVMTVISVREGMIEWYRRRAYQPTGARIPFPFSETSGETRRDFDLVELRKPLR